MKRVTLVAAAVAALFSCMPSRSMAEEVEVAGLRAEMAEPTRVELPRREPLWGTAGASVRTIHGLSFQESESSTTFNFNGGTTHRYRTGGAYPWFDAALADLPAGAQLLGLELEACDTNNATHALATLFRRASPGGGNSVVGSVSTGDAETGGCAFYGGPANLPAGNFVDNRNNAYFIRIELGATDSTTSVGAVRVFYKLRVSPAPAVATFVDVPTPHIYFTVIEALAASGITSGCGAGMFCPNGLVTRGEMAAFLSRALGLHFPN
jgi:hypothetical protein